MATKEKIKKKAPPAPEVERPGSAHSQISVKSADATNITDNTEKFIQDEGTHEKPQEPTTEKKGKTTKSTEKSADQNKKKKIKRRRKMRM